MKNIFIALSVTCLMASCRVADFTMLSTKNVEMSKEYVLKGRQSAKAFHLKTAVDKCIERGGGTYITNVVIYDTGFRYKVVGDVYGTK